MPLPSASGPESRTFRLIELQGTLDSETGCTNENVGDFFEFEGAPCLKIGKQILKGTVVKLKRPLAIMSSRKKEDNPKIEPTIILEKVVFNTRPVVEIEKVMG